jgi:hypothetical protein
VEIGQCFTIYKEKYRSGYRWRSPTNLLNSYNQ